MTESIVGSRPTRLNAETLPPAAYYSQTFHDREVETIFLGDWICVGHASAVREVGDYLSVDLVGEPLVVVRGEDRIRVLSRVCRHRWAPVVSGAGRTQVFSCPFHKWAYGLDGELLAAPFMDEAEGFDMSACALPEIRSEIVDANGLIFVTFSDRTDSIAARIADFDAQFSHWGMAELAIARSTTSDSAFNWKIQVETFMECYHHIGAHPGTFERDQPARLSSCEDGKPGWSVCHSPYRIAAPLETVTLGLPIFPDLDETERSAVHYVNIFPNLLLALRPDVVTVVTVFPEGPTRTRATWVTLTRTETLADPKALARGFAQRAEFMDLALKEDNHVNALQQYGVSSRLARPGRLSRLETTVWDLANYVSARVADARGPSALEVVA